MWVTLYSLLLLSIGAIDWRTRRIPHPLTIFGLLGAILTAPFLPAQFRLNSMLGAVAGLLLFLGIWAAATKWYGQDAFGFGDVMLAALIGAVGGLQLGVQALALGILLAGFASGGALLAGWVSRRDTLPYGTFLAAGAIMRFGYWQLVG